jgi:hypothetical protein
MQQALSVGTKWNKPKCRPLTSSDYTFTLLTFITQRTDGINSQINIPVDYPYLSRLLFGASVQLKAWLPQHDPENTKIKKLFSCNLDKWLF